MSTSPLAGRASDHDVLCTTSTGDHDLPGILESSDDVDDPLLCRLDVTDADRSHELDVLLDDLRGTRGHVGEDLGLQIRTRSLEGQAQLVVVDFLQHGLDALVVDKHDVLEDEHQATNILGEIGMLGLDAVHDRSLGLPVAEVEDLRDGGGPPHPVHRMHQHVREPAFQPAFDLADHHRVGLFHVGDPLNDLDLLFLGQTHQDLRRLVVREVRDDQGDGLRMFILDEGQQVLALGLLEEGKGRLLRATSDVLEHLSAVFGSRESRRSVFA